MEQTQRVRLRPVAEADVAILEAKRNDVDSNGLYNSFGLHRAHDLAQGFAETGLLSESHGTLVVELLSGEFIGSMSYHQVRYGPNTGSIAYNMGISLEKSYRGKGYGTEAQRLIARYLFDTYPVIRVEASTDITNIPEQRSLEKAGFTREGVARKAQWRAGEWHDMITYSLLRGE